VCRSVDRLRVTCKGASELERMGGRHGAAA
jgi:hypothetical protein